uniref:Uncharacterized protein n=1 Tax=Entomoneis paludosa TaxID=265537 RepID=A0A7S2VE10_9STRA
MAQRPDLMQELGSQLQPLIDAKVAAGGGTMGMGATTSPPPASSVTPDVIATTPTVDVSSILSNKNQWDKDDDDGIVDAQIVFTENDDSEESITPKE